MIRNCVVVGNLPPNQSSQLKQDLFSIFKFYGQIKSMHFDDGRCLVEFYSAREASHAVANGNGVSFAGTRLSVNPPDDRRIGVGTMHSQTGSGMGLLENSAGDYPPDRIPTDQIYRGPSREGRRPPLLPSHPPRSEHDDSASSDYLRHHYEQRSEEYRLTPEMPHHQRSNGLHQDTSVDKLDDHGGNGVSNSGTARSEAEVRVKSEPTHGNYAEGELPTIPDCQILLHNPRLRSYGEYVSECVARDTGMKCRLSELDPKDDPEATIARMAWDYGAWYVLVIMEENRTYKSITLNMLRDTPQEHRNMPLNDAIGMLIKENHQTMKAAGNIVDKKTREQGSCGRDRAFRQDDGVNPTTGSGQASVTSRDPHRLLATGSKRCRSMSLCSVNESPARSRRSPLLTSSATRGPAPQRPREERNPTATRDQRTDRDPHPIGRDHKEYRDLRDHRGMRDPREREYRDYREYRDHRGELRINHRDYQQRDSKDLRESRDYRGDARDHYHRDQQQPTRDYNPSRSRASLGQEPDQKSKRPSFRSLFQLLADGNAITRIEDYDDLIDYLKAKRERLASPRRKPKLPSSTEKQQQQQNAEEERKSLEAKIMSLFGSTTKHDNQSTAVALLQQPQQQPQQQVASTDQMSSDEISRFASQMLMNHSLESSSTASALANTHPYAGTATHAAASLLGNAVAPVAGGSSHTISRFQHHYQYEQHQPNPPAAVGTSSTYPPAAAIAAAAAYFAAATAAASQQQLQPVAAATVSGTSSSSSVVQQQLNQFIQQQQQQQQQQSYSVQQSQQPQDQAQNVQRTHMNSWHWNQ